MSVLTEVSTSAHHSIRQPTTMFGRLHADRSDIGAIIDDSSPLSPILGPLIGILGGGTAPGAPPACTNPANVTVQCRRQLYHTGASTSVTENPSADEARRYIRPESTSEERYRHHRIHRQLRSGPSRRSSEGSMAHLSPQYSDFAMFMADQRPDQASFRFQVQLAPGGVNPQGINETQLDAFKDLEANLDTQTAAGATAPTTNIFYSTPGSPPFTPDGAPLVSVDFQTLTSRTSGQPDQHQ